MIIGITMLPVACNIFSMTAAKKKPNDATVTIVMYVMPMLSTSASCV